MVKCTQSWSFLCSNVGFFALKCRTNALKRRATVSMILNGSAHGFLDLKINKTNNPKKSTQVHKNKLGTFCMLNVIKQLQHFILCHMMCYRALKSNIDHGLRPWSILFFSAP